MAATKSIPTIVKVRFAVVAVVEVVKADQIVKENKGGSKGRFMTALQDSFRHQKTPTTICLQRQFQDRFQRELNIPQWDRRDGKV